MSIVIAGEISGSVELQAPDVAGSTVLTLPATSGTVALNGPVFSAHALSTQTVTSGATVKHNFTTEEYDTNSNYDTSLSRFTATVAGYYQFTCSLRAVGTTVTQVFINLYLNGSDVQRMLNFTPASSTGGITGAVSKPIYLGIGDYVEIYTGVIGTGTLQIGGTSISNTSNFSGFLVRAA
jgi:hypothetical protein